MKAKVDPGREKARPRAERSPVAGDGLRDQDTVADIAPPPSPERCRPLAQQTDLGEYVLQEEIGRGGMGVVYRARQKELDRMVAVKMILAGQMASRQMRDLFLAEARAAAKVRHPNIVGVYEVGEAHGWHFIAMELVEGQSLEKMIASAPLLPMAAARICHDVARAVAHLHARGIVHRDLKPSNILMDGEGRPYVSDFGLAKVYETESGQTLSGLLAGTPSYMSPEQAAGKHREVGFTSDVYSAGAVLYHALTGHPPFMGESPQQILARVVRQEALPPRRMRSDIPIPLESICMKCLEKAPERRYQEATALAEDLARFVEGEPVDARPPGPWRRIARWARHQPALAVHLVAMVVFCIIEWAWANFLNRSGPDFHRMVMFVVPVWAVGSWLCQRLLNAGMHRCFAQFSWACMDVLFATVLLLTNDGGASAPLIVLYPLLITASGLWCRTALVWFSTVTCMCSYVLLWAWTKFFLGVARPYDYHVVFLASLAVLGLVAALLSRRTRHFGHAACDPA